jgi:hypothetical protein
MHNFATNATTAAGSAVIVVLLLVKVTLSIVNLASLNCFQISNFSFMLA